MATGQGKRSSMPMLQEMAMHVATLLCRCLFGARNVHLGFARIAAFQQATTTIPIMLFAALLVHNEVAAVCTYYREFPSLRSMGPHPCDS